MLTEQRHEIILNLLSEKGSITVTELKDILNTSESTIRRDLNTLDEQGRLIVDSEVDRKSTRPNSSHVKQNRMPSSA